MQASYGWLGQRTFELTIGSSIAFGAQFPLFEETTQLYFFR